jgi:hypothetical protein
VRLEVGVTGLLGGRDFVEVTVFKVTPRRGVRETRVDGAGVSVDVAVELRGTALFAD